MSRVIQRKSAFVSFTHIALLFASIHNDHAHAMHDSSLRTIIAASTLAFGLGVATGYIGGRLYQREKEQKLAKEVTTLQQQLKQWEQEPGLNPTNTPTPSAPQAPAVPSDSSQQASIPQRIVLGNHTLACVPSSDGYIMATAHHILLGEFNFGVGLISCIQFDLGTPQGKCAIAAIFRKLNNRTYCIAMVKGSDNPHALTIRAVDRDNKIAGSTDNVLIPYSKGWPYSPRSGPVSSETTPQILLSPDPSDFAVASNKNVTFYNLCMKNNDTAGLSSYRHFSADKDLEMLSTSYISYQQCCIISHDTSNHLLKIAIHNILDGKLLHQRAIQSGSYLAKLIPCKLEYCHATSSICIQPHNKQESFLYIKTAYLTDESELKTLCSASNSPGKTQGTVLYRSKLLAFQENGPLCARFFDGTEPLDDKAPPYMKKKNSIVIYNLSTEQIVHVFEAANIYSDVIAMQWGHDNTSIIVQLANGNIHKYPVSIK